MSGIHARIGISNLDVIVKCPATVQLSAPHLPQPDTPESLEGDAAHYVAMAYANGNELAEGAATPQGVPVDADMIAGARLWRDTVGMYGNTEFPVVAARIHPTECFGTTDWWRWDPIEGILRNWDYKYGHKFVDAFECWQLIGYASGLVEALGLNDLYTRVELGIVQPRSYHPDGPVRKWSIMAHELRGYVNLAAHAAHEALSASPTARAGAHCTYCPGRHECRTLQNAANHVADFMGTAERVSLPGDALAAELTILDAAAVQLEARRTGLQAQATAMLRRGERLPGFALEPSVGRLRWKVPVAEVVALGDMMGLQLRKPLEAITPTQAIAAGLDAAVINAQYAERPPGAMKLVPETTAQARKVFGVSST